MIKLVKQNKEMADWYINAIKNGFWPSSIKPDDLEEQVELLKNNFGKWLELRTQKENKVKLPTGELVERIPTDYYWLVNDEMFIGEIAIRHWLNDFTKEYAGHIGYFIRKEMQQKGYGTKMLSLALPRAKQLGLKKVLITAKNTNIGSIKVIKANGGIFDGTRKNPFGDMQGHMERYWIYI